MNHLVKLSLMFEDGSIDWYNNICLGPMFNKPMKNLLSVTYPFRSLLPEQQRLPASTVSFYLQALQNWGFTGFDEQQYTVYPNQVPFNFMEWFSTLTVLRYIYEYNQSVVEWWYEKTINNSQLDSWILFYLAHAYAMGHSGHALIFSNVKSVVDSHAILTTLRATHTGFIPVNKGLQKLWSGHDADEYVDPFDTRTMPWETHYEHLLKHRSMRITWP